MTTIVLRSGRACDSKLYVLCHRSNRRLAAIIYPATVTRKVFGASATPVFDVIIHWAYFCHPVLAAILYVCSCMPIICLQTNLSDARVPFLEIKSPSRNDGQMTRAPSTDRLYLKHTASSLERMNRTLTAARSFNQAVSAQAARAEANKRIQVRRRQKVPGTSDTLRRTGAFTRKNYSSTECSPTVVCGKWSRY